MIVFFHVRSKSLHHWSCVFFRWQHVRHWRWRSMTTHPVVKNSMRLQSRRVWRSGGKEAMKVSVSMIFVLWKIGTTSRFRCFEEWWRKSSYFAFVSWWWRCDSCGINHSSMAPILQTVSSPQLIRTHKRQRLIHIHITSSICAQSNDERVRVSSFSQGFD